MDERTARVVVANGAADSVSVLDARSGIVLRAVTVGVAPEAVAVAIARGDPAQLEACYRRGLGLLEQIGDQRGIVWAWIVRGWVAQGRGDLAAAEAHARRSLALMEQIGDKEGVRVGLFPSSGTRPERSLASGAESGRW